MVLRWHFRKAGGLAVAAYLMAAVGLTASMPGMAQAAELDQLYSQVLQHPGNSELNLRFAQLAEHGGYLRWALSAYERVVVNDPNNSEALTGLTRVRRMLQPDTTLLTVQLGTQYESTPRYYLQPRHDEGQLLGSVALLDERTFNGIRWRTNGVLAGILHSHEHELNYGVMGLETGPVLDAMPGWAFHPAIGGSAAYFDQRFYYSEGSVSGTFDSNTGGVYRAVSVRGAYRSYDDFFPSGHGFYIEARGKLAVPNVLGPGSVAIVSPWVLWSDISGNANVVTPIITELQPGAYIEYGGRVDWIKSVTEWMAFGVNVAISQRNYRTDIVVAPGEGREDTIFSPGASLTFPNLFAYQTDLRFDYRYLMDHSNDVTKRFNDHIVTASIISRFDPTVPPPWAVPKR
jgi:hypothetical protein